MYNAVRLCSSLTQIIIMQLLHGIVNIELHFVMCHTKIILRVVYLSLCMNTLHVLGILCTL